MTLPSAEDRVRALLLRLNEVEVRAPLDAEAVAAAAWLALRLSPTIPPVLVLDDPDVAEGRGCPACGASLGRGGGGAAGGGSAAGGPASLLACTTCLAVVHAGCACRCRSAERYAERPM